MCDPLTIGIGIAVATSAASVIGQIQQANAANASIRAQAKVEEKQVDQQATQDIDNRLRQARRDMGRIMVAAGESGLSLDSGAVKSLQEDAAMQASLDNEQSLATREAKKQAVVADANSKMVSKPTVLGAGLQIGLSALNAAQAGGAFKGKPAAGD